jgi:cell wall-associated NlpC family hydrolase
MKSLLVLLLLLHGLPSPGQGEAASAPEAWPPIRKAIQGNLGRPYVWGASGLKSFDCSGFVWRSLLDGGYLLKRTTARKMYHSLREADPKAPRKPGNLVFFDDLGHVGIVEDEDSFYHSATSKGTSRGAFPGYWGRLVTGYRSLEGLEPAPPKIQRRSK